MFAAQSFNPVQIHNTQNITQDYVHRTQVKLPEGRWLLSIIKGDAWIFQGNKETILHTGDAIEIDNSQNDMIIRSLYARGFARYTLTKVGYA